jgi:carboxypeptidase C (cathepsin A)
MQSIVLLICVVAISVALGAPSGDKITALPGWSGALPSDQYSGYLNVGSSNLHYWFVESESNPKDAPVVLWLNGGPGCSSLDGFVYEMGPFEIQSDNTLTSREYRWNKEVNMLYIESPVGVGFSYSSDDNYVCDDDRTADENMKAIETFFSQFPELAANDLYLFGESYAGVYVPTLAEAILLNNAYTGAPLKGIAVGNGCSGTEVGICGSGPQGAAYQWEYLLQTAFIDQKLKSKINQKCDFEAARAQQEGAFSLECVNLLTEASTEIQNINLYGVYTDCVSDSGCPANHESSLHMRHKVPIHTLETTVEGSSKGLTSARYIPNGPKACIDSKAASSYLNQASVQEALHVQAPASGCWSVCGTQPGWSYNSTRPNLPRDTYPLLVSKIHVTIYNGDWDACVPFTDGEGWTSGMNLPLKNAWHPWKFTSENGATNQVGGYATEYEVNGGTFEFITVKGGIHEVPQSQPAAGYEMMKRVTTEELF